MHSKDMTDKELKSLVASLAEEHKKTEESQRKTETALTSFTEEMRSGQRELRKELGGPYPGRDSRGPLPS